MSRRNEFTSSLVRLVVSQYATQQTSIDRVKVLALLNCDFFDEVAKKDQDELGKCRRHR